MPKTFQMRKGEFGSFQYRIMEFDELSGSLTPVILSEKDVSFDMYKEIQQANGFFETVGFATDIPCSIIDEEEGWVDAPVPEDVSKNNAGMFKLVFNVVDNSNNTLRRYPRYDNQWLRIIDAITGPKLIEGVISDLSEVDPVKGDLVFWDGTGWVIVRAGLPNQILITDPTTGFPKWEEIDIAINRDNDVISGGSA